jgi:hypothetical protein
MIERRCKNCPTAGAQYSDQLAHGKFVRLDMLQNMHAADGVDAVVPQWKGSQVQPHVGQGANEITGYVRCRDRSKIAREDRFRRNVQHCWPRWQVQTLTEIPPQYSVSLERAAARALRVDTNNDAMLLKASKSPSTARAVKAKANVGDCPKDSSDPDWQEAAHNGTHSRKMAR